MLKRVLPQLVIAFLIVLIPLSLQAKRKKKKDKAEHDTFAWEEITDADWQVRDRPLAADADAVVIFEKVEVDHRKTDSLKQSAMYYVRIRILNAEGRSRADGLTSPSWSSEYVTDVQGRTILPNGDIFPLTEENIHKKTVLKTKGAKISQTSFSLPGVTDDCIIEYMILLETFDLSVAWFAQKDIPLLYGEFTWLYFDINSLPWRQQQWLRSADWRFDLQSPEYTWLNIRGKSPLREVQEDSSVALVFRVNDVLPYESEFASAPDQTLRGRLVCYYGSDKPALTFFASWGGGIAYFVDSVLCKDVRKPAELAAELKGETKREKIEAAYRWVRDNMANYTYDYFPDLNDERRSTGHEYDWKQIRDLDDAIKHKEGSRSILCALFRTVLREMGIDARLAYTVDRTGGLFERKTKYWQFDHELVAVFDSAGEAAFYAPGDPRLLPGQLPWGVQGVPALIEGNEGKFVTPPFAQPATTTQETAFSYTISDDLEVTGKLTNKTTGTFARDWRLALLGEETSEAVYFQGAFSEFYGDAQLEYVSSEGIDSIRQPLTVSCKLSYPELQTSGSRLLLRPCQFASKGDNPFTSDQRKNDIWFQSAYVTRDSLEFQLPTEWEVAALPPDTTFENRVGRCEVQFAYEGSMLRVTRAFTLNSPYWTAEDYADIQTLFQARRTLAESIVVLEQTN